MFTSALYMCVNVCTYVHHCIQDLAMGLVGVFVHAHLCVLLIYSKNKLGIHFGCVIFKIVMFEIQRCIIDRVFYQSMCVIQLSIEVSDPQCLVITHFNTVISASCDWFQQIAVRQLASFQPPAVMHITVSSVRPSFMK